jgi:L-asparaginase / beta-aspartyl-peptidase
MMYTPTLVVHGGAGTIEPKDMTPELEAAYHDALRQALAAGNALLIEGGSALDAVTAAVASLEDCPLFNAGRGSVFGYNGRHEMDASIMQGQDKAAGACAGVQGVRNPVMLARSIMERSHHLLLAGEGAVEFARLQQLPLDGPEYFYTEQRYQQWQLVKGTDRAALDHNISLADKKFGTVGAVACDAGGNLAAATSTGGLTNKKYGRVGDTPIIGAGTYASNHTCAISCTGNGEDFIRAVAAYDVSCLMEYRGLSLQRAMEVVVMEKLLPAGGEGGMIGADTKGNTAMVFNSAGMYRGVWHADGKLTTAIYH